MGKQETIADRLLSALKDGKQEGKIKENEYKMIKNVFAFGEKDAKDVMTHRKNIVAIDGEETLEEAARFVLEAKNSRFPVYQDDIDNIIGITHIRDLMRCYMKEELRKKKLCELPECLMPASFIPETRSIDRLFTQMEAKQVHMAIVIDEYGQTAGIVAMEDIIEEIMGNIRDEYDVEEEMIKKGENGEYIADGMTDLSELSDILGIVFSDEDEDNEYETLNGFLIVKLERIPAENEQCKIEYEGYVFEVLHVDNNIIQKVRIAKI